MFRCPKRRENEAFRARIQDTPSAFRLEIEGRFAAADAPEVEARWRAGTSILGTRPLQVDLTRVSWMAPQARALLRRMNEEGANLLLPEAGEEPTGKTRTAPNFANSVNFDAVPALRRLGLLLGCFASRLRSAVGFASG